MELATVNIKDEEIIGYAKFVDSTTNGLAVFTKCHKIIFRTDTLGGYFITIEQYFKAITYLNELLSK